MMPLNLISYSLNETRGIPGHQRASFSVSSVCSVVLKDNPKEISGQDKNPSRWFYAYIDIGGSGAYPNVYTDSHNLHLSIFYNNERP